jgi:hypothetical protein
MEKQILNVLCKYYPNFASNGKVSQLITILIEQNYYDKEFVEWLDFGTHDFYLNAEKDQSGYYREGDHTLYTTNELYEYWKTNIKDK